MNVHRNAEEVRPVGIFMANEASEDEDIIVSVNIVGM